MIITEQVKVNFNKEGQYALWEELYNKGFTSETFPDFCKGAFHDKVDKIKAALVNPISKEEIEKIAMDCVMKLTKASQ